MTYQTTNYFDVTRQDGTHTAANEELVVSDGGTITPPPPTAGETFGVRALRNDVTLTPNSSFEGSTGDRRIDAEGNAVFVSDGTEWYLVSGEEHFGFKIPDSGVSRWEFEQDVTDSWKNNDGTDNTSAGYVAGKVGSYAKNFDGTDDHVEIGDVADLEAAHSFTVTAWVNLNSSAAGSYNTIAAKSTGTFVDSAYELRTDDNDPLSIDAVTFDGNDFTVVPSATISTGTWVHCGIRWEETDGDLSVLLDGSVDNENTSARNPQDDVAEPFIIGGREGGTELFMDGAIDDVRWYDKALTATEYNNLYNTGSIDG